MRVGPLKYLRPLRRRSKYVVGKLGRRTVILVVANSITYDDEWHPMRDEVNRTCLSLTIYLSKPHFPVPGLVSHQINANVLIHKSLKIQLDVHDFTRISDYNQIPAQFGPNTMQMARAMLGMLCSVLQISGHQ